MDKVLNQKISSPRQPARERLLVAAGELFYQEGVQSVGIDKIIERAGVAKASLYSNFSGKDDLVRAYLESRYEARRAAIEAKLALHVAPREKLLAVFDAMAELIAKPNYRGSPSCAQPPRCQPTRWAGKSAGTRAAGRAGSSQASPRRQVR